MDNDSQRRQRSIVASGGSLTSVTTLARSGFRDSSFNLGVWLRRQHLHRRPQQAGHDAPSANMVWTVELELSEPTRTSRSKPTPRRLHERLDATNGVTPSWARILVGGATVAAVVALVFDSYWGGMLLSASMLWGMISVANRRGARRLADVASRHADGFITRSEYETERRHIIHPPIPDYWSAVG